MNNLLPKFKTFSIDNDASKHKKWNPATTDINTAKIPGFLSTTAETKKPAVEFPKIEVDVKAPNDRYPAKTYSIFDPSPLSKFERGVADPAIIRFESKEGKEVDRPLVSPRDILRFVFRVINTFPKPIDLFIQRPSSLQTGVVKGNGGICAGTLYGKTKDYPPDESEILSVYIAISTKIMATVSGRHEVREFRFQAGEIFIDDIYHLIFICEVLMCQGPIGMEVDMQYHRLICTNVLEDSQVGIRG